jgi:hypothetical protein
MHFALHDAVAALYNFLDSLFGIVVGDNPNWHLLLLLFVVGGPVVGDHLFGVVEELLPQVPLPF